MRQYKHGWRLLTLLGILMGFALRLYRLGTTSLWYDETVSVALAQKNLPALLQHTAGDIHPPGYYLLLHYWQALTHPVPGIGLEFLYAWPSLCCGLLLVALVFALGRRLASPAVAFVGLWLAAINPYHIWYSQEVRMYTLGALLGLLGFWALLQWWQGPTRLLALGGNVATSGSITRWGSSHGSAGRANALPYRWLILYIMTGAAGLYTLYYFLFTLFALNSIALLLWLRQRDPIKTRRLFPWLAAQAAIVLLWLPWLPVFWRQATDPPVPPWRTPWTTGADWLADMARSASALISGQSAPAPTAWPWLLLLALLLLGAYFYFIRQNEAVTRIPYAGVQREQWQNGYFVLVLYLLIPLLTLVAITVWVTPLYHVRYLFTYAPPLLVLLAAALHSLYAYGRMKWQRLLGLVATAGLLLLQGWSLVNFWVAPIWQDDDHRMAVSQLAQGWRPGDAILVNAGWVYTALTTYWPTTLVGVDAALPPPLGQLVRLLDYPTLAQQNALTPNPLVVRTGSVDGAPSLGWGEPTSDFFAISTADTTGALATLAQTAHRVWHYRLYDTVNDPQAVIRTWLHNNGALLTDMPIPGRDYLRIQLYQPEPAAAVHGWTPLPIPQARFVGDLRLEAVALFSSPVTSPTTISPTVAAGSYLYTMLTWQPPTNRGVLPAAVSFSLRLITSDGALLAQADETPTLPLAAWPTSYPYIMALPIPVAIPPGAYQLVLVTYDSQTGVPLAIDETAPPRQELLLGPVQIAPATQAPIIPTVMASFDYIDLVRARVTTATAAPGSSLAVEMVWRPRESDYRDTYLGQLILHDNAGQVVEQWEAALGGWTYPSGIWPPLIPVRDSRVLPIAPTTPPGVYTLTLRVLRASDQQLIPAHQSWWRSREDWVVGTVEIRP